MNKNTYKPHFNYGFALVFYGEGQTTPRAGVNTAVRREMSQSRRRRTKQSRETLRGIGRGSLQFHKHSKTCWLSRWKLDWVILKSYWKENLLF